MSHRPRSFGYFEAGKTMVRVVPVGSKIKFSNEKQAFTVQASNRFFSVCTKPFNPKKTTLYTIVDWHNRTRGTENLVFGMGAETKEQCVEMLERLTSGETDISHRNWCDLEIDSVKFPAGTV